jgi:hypothetical protein
LVISELYPPLALLNTGASEHPHSLRRASRNTATTMATTPTTNTAANKTNVTAGPTPPLLVPR